MKAKRITLSALTLAAILGTTAAASAAGSSASASSSSSGPNASANSAASSGTGVTPAGEPCPLTTGSTNKNLPSTTITAGPGGTLSGSTSIGGHTINMQAGNGQVTSNCVDTRPEDKKD